MTGARRPPLQRPRGRRPPGRLGHPYLLRTVSPSPASA